MKTKAEVNLSHLALEATKKPYKYLEDILINFSDLSDPKGPNKIVFIGCDIHYPCRILHEVDYSQCKFKNNGGNKIPVPAWLNKDYNIIAHCVSNNVTEEEMTAFIDAVTEYWHTYPNDNLDERGSIKETLVE